MRERPRGRVEIDLDGAPWRLVPVDAVVRVNLLVGSPLDRSTARALARELRRAAALGVAARALRHRDLSRRRLEERLAGRGAGAAARSDALETLERAGLVDDARTAATRGSALATRGYGDEAIRFTLEQEGFDAAIVATALAGLAPEADRARELLARWGGGAKGLRRLAARGFEASLVEDLTGFADGA